VNQKLKRTAFIKNRNLLFWGQYFFNEINIFIQQGCVQFI